MRENSNFENKILTMSRNIPIVDHNYKRIGMAGHIALANNRSSSQPSIVPSLNIMTDHRVVIYKVCFTFEVLKIEIQDGNRNGT